MKRALYITAMMLLFAGGQYLYGQTKGEGWLVYYIDDIARVKFYYDKMSLARVEKDKVTVWQKVTEEVRPNDEQEKMKIHLKIDCRQKTYDVLSAVSPSGFAEVGDIYSGHKKRYIEEGQLRALMENVCP
ncbi:MAG: hypothetical protein N2745_06250 [Syntrophorhabdaceae bacterium]|nr:hypothetical protein [Syntrophorhabdaceae bacterium]